MHMTTSPRRSTVAAAAANAGAAVAMDRFRTGIDIETKDGKTDVVTEADRLAQREVIKVIKESFPDDAIVGEEDDELKSVPDNGPAWVIDPIDGTNNYVRNIRLWGTAVAAVIDGEPVAAANVFPALGDTYTADETQAYRNGEPIAVSTEEDPQRCAVCPTIWWDFDNRDEYARATSAIVHQFGDLRRYGCAQAALSLVASGSLDGVNTNIQPNPWDTVAGVHLIRSAGGMVTDIHGDRWRHDSTGLVASSGAIHGEVLQATRAIEQLDD